MITFVRRFLFAYSPILPLICFVVVGHLWREFSVFMIFAAACICRFIIIITIMVAVHAARLQCHPLHLGRSRPVMPGSLVSRTSLLLSGFFVNALHTSFLRHEIPLSMYHDRIVASRFFLLCLEYLVESI